jgi:hypothetical protein
MDASTENQEERFLRNNKDVEAAVNRGIMVAMISGVAAGAVQMRKEGVPIDVSARVLMKPEQRRASDWR